MSRKSTDKSRNVSISQTPENFFIAIKPPYDKRSNAFKHFNSMAVGVRMLKEGSQVFIYEKETFNYGSDPEEAILEHTEEIIDNLGEVALDKQIKTLAVHSQ